VKSNSIAAKIKMLDMGIAPAFSSKELKEMLDSLPENERNKVKRKFRKIWRKLLKDEDESLKSLIFTKNGEDPTDSQKRNRSVLVIQRILKNIQK
jgi:mRNA-degrading endonuclease RelE of RelBE toxin-antitoxin system